MFQAGMYDYFTILPTGRSCSCLNVCKLNELLLEMCCPVSLFPLNKQVANKNHVRKSYLWSILTCLYRGVQYKLVLICRKINFLDLSGKQARCTLLCLAFTQHAAERIPSFSWHPTDTQTVLCDMLAHHIQEKHIYIEYLNTSFFTSTCLFSL